MARWSDPTYDDTTWSRGESGFGTSSTPGSKVHTEWNSSDIWLRLPFELDSNRLHAPQLLLHHDEDAEIYVNGKLVSRVNGYTTSYGLIPLGPDTVGAFKAGRNVLAVHCHQTGGGQYIDVGLVDFIEKGHAKVQRTTAVP